MEMFWPADYQAPETCITKIMNLLKAGTMIGVLKKNPRISRNVYTHTLTDS